jgi:hypothetical protein
MSTESEEFVITVLLHADASLGKDAQFHWPAGEERRRVYRISLLRERANRCQSGKEQDSNGIP